MLLLMFGITDFFKNLILNAIVTLLEIMYNETFLLTSHRNNGNTDDKLIPESLSLSEIFQSKHISCVSGWMFPLFSFFFVSCIAL